MAIDQHRRCALVRLELERRLLRNAPIVSSGTPSRRLDWSKNGVTLTVPVPLARRVSRPVQSQPTLASRHLRTGYQNFHRGRCRRSLKSTWNPSKTHPESCAAIIITSRSSKSDSLLRYTGGEMILTEMAPGNHQYGRLRGSSRLFRECPSAALRPQSPRGRRSSIRHFEKSRPLLLGSARSAIAPPSTIAVGSTPERRPYRSPCTRPFIGSPPTGTRIVMTYRLRGIKC